MTTHHTNLEEKIMIFVSINALLQFIADVILEAKHILPTRINHLSLTLMNAFLSYKTLSAIKKDMFRFLHEDVQSLILLEILLIFGDLFYLMQNGWDDFTFIWVRLSFIALSMFNLIYISTIMVKYKLYHLSYMGVEKIVNEEVIERIDDIRDDLTLTVNKQINEKVENIQEQITEDIKECIDEGIEIVEIKLNELNEQIIT